MSHASTPGVHLQRLVLDSNATTAQKVACLKTLRVVVKNLADPTKGADPKYRQLKLSNEKVKAKFSPCPSASEYMKALGFASVREDGEEFLRIDGATTVVVSDVAAALVELDAAVEMLAPKEPSFSEEKKTPEGVVARQQSSLSTSSASATGRASEKQKARLLMEKKRQKEAQEAKEARRKTSKLIRQDKYVRENDDNWTSKQSAACVKSGTGINTFRDKYGEN